MLPSPTESGFHPFACAVLVCTGRHWATGEPGAVRDLEDGENAQVARVRAQLAFHPKRHALSENAKAMSLQVRPPLEEPASLSHTLF